MHSSLAEGIARSVCISKMSFASKEDADVYWQAVKLRNPDKTRQKPYRCRQCRQWHLATRRRNR